MLRLRWQWLCRNDSTRAWSGLELQFPVDERALFFASTSMVVGDGKTTKFWEDRWTQGKSIREIAPELYACIPKRRRKSRTVANGLQARNRVRDIIGTIGVHEIGQYLRLWIETDGFALTDQPDQLIWKWNTSTSYSASSCYTATFHGSIATGTWKMIWKCWFPPKVKFSTCWQTRTAVGRRSTWSRVPPELPTV